MVEPIKREGEQLFPPLMGGNKREGDINSFTQAVLFTLSLTLSHRGRGNRVFPPLTGGNAREGEAINAIGGLNLLFSSQLIIRIKQIKTSFLKILGANNLLQKSAKSASSAVKKSRRDPAAGGMAVRLDSRSQAFTAWHRGIKPRLRGSHRNTRQGHFSRQRRAQCRQTPVPTLPFVILRPAKGGTKNLRARCFAYPDGSVRSLSMTRCNSA